MCIIIVKPKGHVLTKRELRNSWDGNDDGAGFVYAKDGKLVVVKELHSFKRYWRQFQGHNLNNINVILHFRILSSGAKDINNVHPFPIDEHHALVHNGILSCVKVPDKSPINDTQIFIEEYLRCMKCDDGSDVDWVNNNYAKDYAEALIGALNKMAIINTEGEYVIWNEKAGHWNLGCWYSNNSYKHESYSSGRWGNGVGYTNYLTDDYKEYKSPAQKEWESRWNRTYQAPDNVLKLEIPGPESCGPFEPDTNEEKYESCLQCGTPLLHIEIQAGWGCCTECAETAGVVISCE